MIVVDEGSKATLRQHEMQGLSNGLVVAEGAQVFLSRSLPPSIPLSLSLSRVTLFGYGCAVSVCLCVSPPPGATPAGLLTDLQRASQAEFIDGRIFHVTSEAVIARGKNTLLALVQSEVALSCLGLWCSAC